MDLNEILQNHATSIASTQEALKNIATYSKENFEKIDEYQKYISSYNKELSLYLKENKKEMQRLTALVQVLHDELLEVRKMLGK
jgi:DNA-directed RNA polymerase alpha subunit